MLASVIVVIAGTCIAVTLDVRMVHLVAALIILVCNIAIDKLLCLASAQLSRCMRVPEIVMLL